MILRNSVNWGFMERLVEKVKQFPVTKTLGGSYIDGQALVELVVRLAETMNKNSWPDFGSVYDTIEKSAAEVISNSLSHYLLN